jgi:hypothetical protein
MALRAGLTEGHFSKILRGDRRGIRSATLEAILKALPAELRGGFLAAYLRDLVPESFAGLLFSDEGSNRLREVPANYGDDLEFEALVETLRKNFRSPRRGEIVRMLQRLTENSAVNTDFLRGLEHLSNLEIS